MSKASTRAEGARTEFAGRGVAPSVGSNAHPPDSPWSTVAWGTLDATRRRTLLDRPAQATASETRSGVARIIEQVRADGDGCLRALTRRFDGVQLDGLRVDDAEFAAAEQRVSAELRAAMQRAADRIRTFHAAGAPLPYSIDTAPGVRCGRVLRPIETVGLYVPAGSAPLPSTALMLGVPAKQAGCPNVVLCSPPDAEGRVDPSVLVAARLCGIRDVFKLGGAQAIAAMAFGTESVPACDKLFGPGNAWVTEAKQQVSTMPGGPAIDMPAGPSEVLVIADAAANADFVAADLLSQAEHGPDSQVLLVSDSASLIERVKHAVAEQLRTLPRRDTAAASLQHARWILTDDLDVALQVSNLYAPEHLILQVERPDAYLDAVRAAGSVFLGALSPEALGDYCSGTNHVLPTYGAARAYSGVSLTSFMRLITVQSVTAEGLRAIGPDAVALAEAERLHAHARAVSLRLDALDAMASADGESGA
ncbi:MAG: histidinol dehydrogenase [Xanthomonadales bacterium]|nr:histidinol dehydrogenase [Xanthomonadales bacterium]